MKAQEDGATFSEAFEYAKEICSNKNETGTPTNETGTPTNENGVPTNKSDTPESNNSSSGSQENGYFKSDTSESNNSSSGSQGNGGYFFGIVPVYSGTGESHNDHIYIKRTILTGSNAGNSEAGVYRGGDPVKEDINGGIGFKFGWDFPGEEFSVDSGFFDLPFSIYYAGYNFEFADVKFGKNTRASLSLLMIDTFFNFSRGTHGVFMGLGLGNGTLENSDANFSETGFALMQHIGFRLKPQNNISYSVGYLSGDFGYDIPSSTLYRCGTETCREDRKYSYDFSVETFYFDLIYHFY